jgi:predicted TIM-barrel fold metal-dependent hydrolase
MAHAAIIDALFGIPRIAGATQISDCVPFNQDLGPLMQLSGIAGAVLAPANCVQCPHQWNCADRMTHEIISVVAQSPQRLRGLGSYDLLRVGDSLRWIDEGVIAGGLAGVYVPAECCVAGLEASLMYPLYGLCARLRCPVVIDIPSRERWLHHRPQVELVAADFPELDVLLAPPPSTDAASIIPLIERFPRVSFLLCPQELQSDAVLCKYVELEGRERALFRSSPEGWQSAVEIALGLPLGRAAQRAYLSENATRLFNFSVDVPNLTGKEEGRES